MQVIPQPTPKDVEFPQSHSSPPARYSGEGFSGERFFLNYF